jgi:hypothetical protein
MSGIQKLLFVVAVFVLGSHFSIARAQERADLLLVLAADISYSIDAPSFKMQRAGYAQAITDPQVINAIHGGPIGRIAVCYVEWSGETAQKLVVDWTLIADSDDAHKFAARIIEAPRSFSDRTSISGAIAFATDLFERAPYAAASRILEYRGTALTMLGGGRSWCAKKRWPRGSRLTAWLSGVSRAAFLRSRTHRESWKTITGMRLLLVRGLLSSWQLISAHSTKQWSGS